MRRALSAENVGDRHDLDDLSLWLDELQRLVYEARERLDRDDVIPALASLAAMPPVHMTLVDGCRARLQEEAGSDGGPSDPVVGLYL